MGPYTLTRRTMLQGCCGGIAGGIASVTAIARLEAVASVRFDDQTTDGREIVIASVRTSVDAKYVLTTEDHAMTFAEGVLEGGTDVEGFVVRLHTPLERNRVLKFALYPRSGGSVLAKDTAEIIVSGDVEYVDGLALTRVNADPDIGFHYPYFLYAPPARSTEALRPILVEPNNTGQATDDFAAHEQAAKTLVERGIARRISDQLEVPLLVPVFPRPMSVPVDSLHYVHQLDRDTLQVSSGPLERIDLQLLRMVDDARRRLEAAAHSVADRILMNGFSASGNFVERFAVLHPDRVLSITAGGLNGMVVLPLERAKGHTLKYPVGIADVESITGTPVDLEALDEVNQFLYMGSEDHNDTIPYRDAWTSDEIRETAVAIYGENMIKERFPYCQTAYEQAGVNAQFRIFQGVGHSPSPVADDIVEFHRRSIEGEDVSDLGRDVRLDVTFEVTPSDPVVGETVEFDASRSRTNTDGIRCYTWDFDDGGSAAGETVTHVFTEPGRYAVRFRFVDDTGWVEETTTSLAVEGNDDGSDADAPETTSIPDQPTETARPPGEPMDTTTAPRDPTEASGNGGGAPGFGIVGALAGFLAAVYLLKRRSDTGER